MSVGRCLPQEQIDKMSDQELAVWYNDHVIYPDKAEDRGDRSASRGGMRGELTVLDSGLMVKGTVVKFSC